MGNIMTFLDIVFKLKNKKVKKGRKTVKYNKHFLH